MKLVLVSLLAACSFPTPSEEYACRTSDDCAGDRVCTQGYCVLGNQSGTDGSNGSGNMCAAFSSRHFDACAIPAPSGPLALTTAGTYTFDTGTGTLTDPGGASSVPTGGMVTNGRVLSVTSFTVGTGAILRVQGTAPLIVAAWTTLEVDGTIDASSLGAPTTRGAGANPTECSAHAATAGTANNEGGGGGGGGGGQGTGGMGGRGDPNGNGVGGPGGAGVPIPLLLGGCAGAKGGNGGSIAGEGGDGGGAVQLTAKTSISITGKITAGGAGGKQAGPSGDGGGGGGGGAGGTIGLEAPTVTVASGAVLAANGGGGGEGGGNQGTGQAGKNALASAAAATGGAGGSGGDGGPGSAAATLVGGAGQPDGAGGGGAGGAAGFIAIKGAATTTGAILSPPAITIP